MDVIVEKEIPRESLLFWSEMRNLLLKLGLGEKGHLWHEM